MTDNKKFQQIEIDTDLAMDIEQILNGGFSPLTTFLDKKSLDSVLKNMRLPTGEIWPIPILFPKKIDEPINSLDSLLLKFQGHDFAVLEEPETFEYDLDKLITSFYGTNDEKHPGVQISRKSPHIFITGKLRGISKLNHKMSKILSKKTIGRVLLGFIPETLHIMLMSIYINQS